MLIGFAPVFVKWSELSSSAILFWRMFLALPMLAILNYFLNKTFIFKVKNKNTILYTAIAFFVFTTDLILWHYSMNITSVSNATIIVNSAPIFVALFAYTFSRKCLQKVSYFFLITYLGITGLIIFLVIMQMEK